MMSERSFEIGCTFGAVVLFAMLPFCLCLRRQRVRLNVRVDGITAPRHVDAMRELNDAARMHAGTSTEMTETGGGRAVVVTKDAERVYRL